MQHIRLETSLKQKTHTAIQMSLYFERWRKDFWSHVRDIESGELFMRLWMPDEKGRKALFINPRPVSRLIESSGAHCNLSFDVEDPLERYKDIVAKLRALGREAFTALFLGEQSCTPAELSELTGLTISELKAFQDDVLTPAAIQDMTTGFQIPEPASGQFEKVAIVKREGDKIECLFLSEKKRYRIDEEKIARLSAEGSWSDGEMESWKELKRELEYINSRISLINDVVLAAVNAQRRFLLSGADEDLNALEEKDVAKMLTIDTSWLCRLIQGKSIVTPHGEKPVQSLFLPRRKAERQKGMMLLKKLMAARRGQRISDIELQKQMQESYGLTVSRRTVNDWRRALGTHDFS